jgi:UDP-glucose 4-epimerase
VSTGRETSVLELAAALGVPHRFAPGRPGEIARSCLDPTAAQRALRWRAKATLMEGLERTMGQLV